MQLAMSSTLWLVGAVAMLPAMALVAWLRYADDPTDEAMSALFGQGGPCFTGPGCAGASQPSERQPPLISPTVLLLFPPFHNPGLTP
jgi:hypothetical protein